MRLFARWTLLTLPAFLLLAATAAAQDEGGHHHGGHADLGPHEVCQLFPNSPSAGHFEWTLGRDYEHGGEGLVLLERPSPTQPSNKVRLEIPGSPASDPIRVPVDHNTVWTLQVPIEGIFSPNLLVPGDVLETKLLVDATATVRGHPVANAGQAVRVYSTGLAPNAYGYVKAVLNLEFVPQILEPAVALSEIGTELFFRLNDPAPVAQPGVLKLRLDLSAGDHGPGSMLSIPGQCPTGGPHDGHESGETQEAQAHVHEGAQPKDPSCAAGTGCDSRSDVLGPEAIPEEVEPAAPAADASNMLAPAWGSTVVAATIGVAGLTFFRPRPPPQPLRPLDPALAPSPLQPHREGRRP